MSEEFIEIIISGLDLFGNDEELVEEAEELSEYENEDTNDITNSGATEKDTHVSQTDMFKFDR